MKQIPLTQGKVALVDDDIYEAIGHLKWYANQFSPNLWYAVRNLSAKDSPTGKRTIVKLHHFVVGKPSKVFEVDHIDGNGLNNQRSNLRVITGRENQQNQFPHRKGKLVGTYFRKARAHLATPWQAQIEINNKMKYLGCFATEQEAHQAYQKELEKLNKGDL